MKRVTKQPNTHYYVSMEWPFTYNIKHKVYGWRNRDALLDFKNQVLVRVPLAPAYCHTDS